ncbi:MAG: GerMN domain-containing protein [Pontimonas sp.]|nr:GerMN domain-containing protein [Pontimonas sp.]
MLIALLAGVIILTSCTSIPSSGDVESAEIDTGLSNADVDFLPPGPSAGATPAEIVQGFIAAGTAAQDNYRVARSYLAESLLDGWNPNLSVAIRAGEPVVTATSETSILYTVPVIANVDEFGRYSSAASSTDQRLEFELVQESGEWRISGAPDGIVLSEPAFREAFSSYRLYYFSSGYRDLVADVRWFASRGEVSTKIVRSLLEEPSFWLNQGATVSAFPEGSQLALTPIPVTDGVAQVDLTTSVLSANEVTRARMLLQLSASLSQVQGISSARLSVNQVELVIPPLDDEGPSLASGRDGRIAVLLDRRFGYVQAGRIEQLEGLSSEVAGLIPRSLFYSAAFDQVAATRFDGLWLVREGESAALIDARPDLIRPIIDSCGYIWSSASLSSPDMASIISQNGQVSPLSMELGDDAQLVSFELARDNTRLLLMVQTATGVRVLLTAVERDTDCRPQSLGDFIELGPLTGSAVDAAWVDDSSVAVVVKDAQTGSGEVVVFDTNGRSTSLGRPTRPATLVGTIGGVPGLRLLSDDGLIYQPRGNGWQGTGERASVLATQR